MEEAEQKIASLIKDLTHPNKRVVREAADALISLAPVWPRLADRLEQLLSELPKESCWPVAYVLAQIARPSAACVTVLKETLGSHDPDIRWAIGLLLVRLGKANPAIVTQLLELLKTGTPTQRRMAIYCLRDMELSDGASLEALVQALGDPAPLVRVAAVSSLKIRELTNDGLDLLLRLFREDPDARVRHTAAITLAHRGAPTREIRTALEQASRSSDPQLKKAATAALGLLEKKRPAAAPK